MAYERYANPDYVEKEMARVSGEASIRHIFNAGAYRLCVPEADRDPEIMRNLDALAGQSQHTLNRQNVIRDKLGYEDPMIKGDGKFERVAEALQDPEAGLDAVPAAFKATAPTIQTNLHDLMGLPKIRANNRGWHH